MDPGGLLTYALALAALTAAPGPLVAILIARTLSRDVAGAAAFAVGLGIGDLAAVVLVCVGVGAAAPEVLAGLKWAGAAYLMWTAFGMWTATPPAPAAAPLVRRRMVPMALAGALTCLGSPQTLVVYLALLPGAMAPERLSPGDVAALLAATAAATLGVFAAVIVLARQARRSLVTPRTARLCNQALAVTTAGAAAWIVAI